MQKDAVCGKALEAALQAASQYWAQVDDGPVTVTKSAADIRTDLAEMFDFVDPIPAETLVELVAERMANWQVNTPHRRYWGLYNPGTLPITVAADALVAAFNPQLAAWSHAPGPIEVERHVLRLFMRLYGWDTDKAFGSFTSGGAEANYTGVLAGLTARIPSFAEQGSPGGVRIYVSREVHHSVVKVAHQCGVGRQSIVEIDVDDKLAMRSDLLQSAIDQDRNSELSPTIVFATVGTTAAGASDPLHDLADIADKEGLWLHVDAAWAGTAVLSDKLRVHLDGIERADSITADAHKWMSVPMGAGMSFVKDASVVSDTFAIQTQYMPANEGPLDPYSSSAQWSRRFTGLKVFMALAEKGIGGMACQIERHAEVGEHLKKRLIQEGWMVVNDSPFAVVCFTRPGIDPAEVAAKVRQSQQAWLSHVRLSHYGVVLRACVTNYRTDESDVEALITTLRTHLN